MRISVRMCLCEHASGRACTHEKICVCVSVGAFVWVNFVACRYTLVCMCEHVRGHMCMRARARSCVLIYDTPASSIL